MTPRYVVKYNKYMKLSLDEYPKGGYYIYDNEEHVVHSRYLTHDSAVDRSFELNEGWSR